MLGGDFDLSGQFTMNSGSTVNISGGTVDIGTNIRINGGELNISGGTINVAGVLGRGGITTFTGGTTTANELSFLVGTQMVFGAGSAGSVAVTTGFTDNVAARNIDWLTGSQMTLSIAVANWAETEWAAGRMFYNGVGFGTLGNWATVTGTGGLGGAANFSYVGNTLSVIPEPSAIALMAFGLGVLVIRRRRHTA